MLTLAIIACRLIANRHKNGLISFSLYQTEQYQIVSVEKYIKHTYIFSDVLAIEEPSNLWCWVAVSNLAFNIIAGIIGEYLKLRRVGMLIMCQRIIEYSERR